MLAIATARRALPVVAFRALRLRRRPLALAAVLRALLLRGRGVALAAVL